MAHSLRFLVFITLSYKSLMEALKTFENLSETEKLKFFEVLSSNESKGATAESDKSLGCSPRQLSLNFLLENLKNASKKIDAENDHLGDNSNCRELPKKQKTLDGWLLKSRNTSFCRNNELSPTLKRSDENVNSIPVSKACNSSQLPTSNYNTSSLLSPTHGCSNSAEDLNLTNNTLQKSTGSKENSLAISPNIGENENLCVESPYNLRRKRKSSKLILSTESDDNNVKIVRNNADLISSTKISDIDKDVRNECFQNSPLPDLAVRSCIDGHDSTCNLITEQLQGVSKYIHLAKKIEDQLHSSNMNIFHENKTSYNLRTKKKKSRKLQEWLQLTGKSSTSCSTSKQDTIGNVVDQPAPEDNVHNSKKTSSFNYEAFSALNETCNQFGLNIYNILQQEGIQNLLKDEEKDPLNDSVFLIGAHKSATGQIVPIVHMHESKAKLIKDLSEIQNFH